MAIRTLYGHLATSDIAKILDPAFHAFNSMRKKTLKLNPGVRETLEILSHVGISIVAHTESKLYSVVDRLQRLDLHKYFSTIYCRERSSLGISLSKEKNFLDNFPMHKIVELSQHQSKPNESVLREICASQGVSPKNSAYV